VIPKECKRLAEVDFPIAVVSKHAAREKSIRHGHPSTLHLWWARRPLASSRAVMLALLLPDPCDPHCPSKFKGQAREILRPIPGRVGDSNDDLREALLRFIGDFADWDNADNSTFLVAARDLVKAAHLAETPLIVDPFAGGGSIPLEALRLGCDALASDLNPVACLILKTMLEDIPRYGPGLADELRHLSAEIKKAAEKELVEFYPRDPDGARPIAYLWARTVRCEAPNCGAEIPIYRSPWLSRRGATRARFFRENANGGCVALLIESAPRRGPIKFRLARGDGSENPKSGYVELRGTKARGNNANVICPCCATVLAGNKKNPRTVSQLAAQRGGSDVVFDAKGRRVGGARLLAVVTMSQGQAGRQYRMPTERDYDAVRRAQERVANIITAWEREGKQGLCPIPNEALPPIGTLGFRVQRYGMLEWGDLFTSRQKLALLSVCSKLDEVTNDSILRDVIGLSFSRWTDIFNALCQWESSKTQVRHLFTRQAIPILWDFAENGFSTGQAGDFEVTQNTIAEVIDALSCIRTPGQVTQADARKSPLPSDAAGVWFTDPPYYDAVPYADLSDFFFVWLKRALPNHPLMRDPMDPANPLTPKLAEAVQDETKTVNGHPKDRVFFEEAMAAAFAEGRRIIRDDAVGSVVFAHKTTEGWEALLSGMTKGGWVVTGSWPIATESATRLRARDSAALATSVHLVCRPRTQDVTGDWGEVLRELPGRVADWMARLEREGVRGADLVFACIGPALEIFSRYARVETPDGREVQLAEYLEKVWEVVGRAALEQVLGTAEAQARNGGAGALEEDARLTALFLWTIESTAPENDVAENEAEGDEDAEKDEEESGGAKRTAKGLSLVFDIARRFAQPLGIHLETWQGRIIDIEKGVVRLLPVSERARQLFGEEGTAGLAERIERAPAAPQLDLFPEAHDTNPPKVKGGRGRAPSAANEAAGRPVQATTLDRVHAAMLLQASGRANALRALLAAEQERGPDFLRLANALSALYPQGCEEKRLLDAMLLALPR
jgi:putative DNA methylase